MSGAKKLSALQREVLRRLAGGKRVERLDGGFWVVTGTMDKISATGAPIAPDGKRAWYTNINTLNGLAKRGLVGYAPGEDGMEWCRDRALRPEGEELAKQILEEDRTKGREAAERSYDDATEGSMLSDGECAACGAQVLVSEVQTRTEKGTFPACEKCLRAALQRLELKSRSLVPPPGRCREIERSGGATRRCNLTAGHGPATRHRFGGWSLLDPLAT